MFKSDIVVFFKVLKASFHSSCQLVITDEKHPNKKNIKSRNMNVSKANIMVILDNKVQTG